jgi:protein SCO1/2
MLKNVRFVLWGLVGFAVAAISFLTWQVVREATLELGRPMAEGADWKLTDEGGPPFYAH